MIELIIRLSFEGYHCWPDCPYPDVAYLRDRHRHIFYVECVLPVTHDNRDIEFIRFRRQVIDYLASLYPDREMGSTSCEMIARDLTHVFGLTSCSVFEDNENGARFHAKP